MTKAMDTTNRAAAAKSVGAKPAGKTHARQVNQTDRVIRDVKPSVVASTTKQPRQTKAALLRTMLEAPGGARLTCIMEETGWQAHTVRAALTALRKAGLHLTRRRDGDNTIYAIDDAVEATLTVIDGSDGELKVPDSAVSVPDDDGSGSASSGHGTAAAGASV